MDKLKDYLIKLLGGCTRKEFRTYKRTVYKHIKAMKLIDGLTEDEELILRQYREERALRKGKAKLNYDRLAGKQ